jgi:ATP-binding cassette subfamily B protein
MGNLLEYIRPYWRRLSVGIVAAFAMRFARLIPALAIAAAIDRVIRGSTSGNSILAMAGLIPATVPDLPGAKLGLLHQLALIAASAWALQAVAQFTSRYLFQSTAQKIQHDLRDDTYAHMQRLSLDFFNDHQTGAMMSILNSDINRLENFFNSEIRQIIRAIVMFGVVGAVMFYKAPRLAVIALAPMPVLGIATGRFMMWIEPKYRRIRELVSRMNTRLQNNLGGAEIIKSFDRYGVERERVAVQSRDYRDRKVDVIRIRKAFFASQRVLIGAAFVSVLVFGGHAVVADPIMGVAPGLTAGTFVLFFMFLKRLDGPLQRIGKTANKYQKTKSSAERIFGILGHEPAIESPEDALAPDRVNGHIQFDDVVFSYGEGGETILEGVDLDVEAGQTVGFAGTSGSGKSTLLKLLPRYHDVDEGAVRVDGENAESYGVQALRDRIGIVEQDPYMFSGTVRENIAYGHQDTFESVHAAEKQVEEDIIEGEADAGENVIASREITEDIDDAVLQRVTEAAKAAGAHEFISELPNGYDTMVGERGVKLSGGQRQRLSIARALLNDPDIIILDEATSDVDTETEELIQENLDRLCEDRTAFVIAHRLSTIKDADRIVVMEDGEIIEEGTHTDLVRDDSTYAGLWESQVDMSRGAVPADD